MAAWSSVTGNNDKVSDVYKVFHRSSTRNLLYLQSRVAALQDRQARFDREDYRYRLPDCDAKISEVFTPSRTNVEDLEAHILFLLSVEEQVKRYERDLEPATQREEQIHIGEEEQVALPHQNHPQFAHQLAHGHGTEETSSRIELATVDYESLHSRLKNLEESRNKSKAFPPLPRDLFWGPVSDRRPRVSSGVPEDFMHYKECKFRHVEESRLRLRPEYCFELVKEPNARLSTGPSTGVYCPCDEAYRQSQKQYQDIIEAKKGSDIMQMFQQRSRTLEDYFEQLCLHQLKMWQPAHDIVAQIRAQRKAPSLAITLVARSWEYFEMFGSAEKMWEWRRNWDELELGQPWPFDMSDYWVGKMRDRWNAAIGLQHALKEYCKHRPPVAKNLFDRMVQMKASNSKPRLQPLVNQLLVQSLVQQRGSKPVLEMACLNSCIAATDFWLTGRI